MRLTIGSYILDGTPASSTTTTAALRLPFDIPFAPRVAGNELRLAGLRVFVVAASESALKTDVDAITAQFDSANGKTVTFYNTTGTALFDIDTSEWPEVEVEYEVDYGDDNAEIVFDVVARRPEPVSTGGATGQRGEIEWELEIGPNGLTGAVAIGEFGPTGAGASAWENAAAWVASLFAEPPTGIPTFLSNRLRAVQARPVSRQKPNQATITDESYDPVTVMVTFRQVYSGLGTIPSDVTDVVVNVNVANSEAMDIRSGEAQGPAIVVLSGYFYIKTEAPTEFLSAATSVDRGAIYQRGQTVYDSIEADFRTIYAQLSLHDLGAVELDISPDSGRVVFRRSFSTTRVLVWRETTRVNNVDPVIINRDHKGRDHVHHGRGGPVASLSHTLYIESMDVVPYTPPTLDSNWVRLDRGQDVTVEAQLRGGRIIFTTNGSSNWRYANPSERGPSDQATAGAGKVLTLDNIGNGTL